jgi:hypothetical protein
MNHLPQNELLSAYLDGELTADEQAEVERLLASSPAARQLLDDLRAVSATLQSLPRQKLGEDLTQQVLRAAERRMLTEGEPGGDTAPVPNSRSLFRRFINRRSMAWLAITAAVAVMITLHEQHEKSMLAGKAGREIALAPKADDNKTQERTTNDLASHETIQAAPDAAAEGDLRRKAANGPLVEKKLGEAAIKAQVVASPPKPTEAARLNNEAGYAGLPAMEPRAADSTAAPASATPQAATPRSSSQGQTAKVAGKGLNQAGGYGVRGGPAGSQNWYDADGPASIGPDVLLVFCDVSPQAAKKEALYRVLSANGIAIRKDSLSKDKAKDGQDRYEQLRDTKHLSEEVVERRLPAGVVVRRRIVADNAELVYVEATPEQVTATLADLAAQPKAFVAVSVKSPQDEAARKIVRRFANASDGRQVAEGRKSGVAGMPRDETRQKKERELPRLAAAKPAGTATTGGNGLTKSEKGDLAAASGRDEKKTDGTRKHPADKSGKGRVDDEFGDAVAKSANEPPSFGGGGQPPVAARGLAPSAKPNSEPEGGLAASGVVPAGQRAGATKGEKSQLETGGRRLRLAAQSSRRQRVLFVIRMGDAPSLASEIESKPVAPAKQAPAAVPADSTPAK